MQVTANVPKSGFVERELIRRRSLVKALVPALAYLLMATFIAACSLSASTGLAEIPAATDMAAASALKPLSPILVTAEGYQPGTVIAQLKRTPNYPQGTTPAPQSANKSDFVSATVLSDGRFIVDTGVIRISKVLSPSNLAALRSQSARLARATLKTEMAGIVCSAMPPLTRANLSVAASADDGKSLSDELGTVWLEDGCSYGLHLNYANASDRELAGEVRAKIEAIAYELIEF